MTCEFAENDHPVHTIARSAYFGVTYGKDEVVDEHVRLISKPILSMTIAPSVSDAPDVTLVQWQPIKYLSGMMLSTPQSMTRPAYRDWT